MSFFGSDDVGFSFHRHHAGEASSVSLNGSRRRRKWCRWLRMRSLCLSFDRIGRACACRSTSNSLVKAHAVVRSYALEAEFVVRLILVRLILHGEALVSDGKAQERSDLHRVCIDPWRQRA